MSISFQQLFWSQNLYLKPPRLHFGDLGRHFGVFLEALTPLAAQLGHFWGSCQRKHFFAAEGASHLGSFLGSVLLKLTKTCKQWHPESS